MTYLPPIFMLFGAILIIPALIAYLYLNNLESRLGQEKAAEKFFKKEIRNPMGMLDLIHVILLGVMILGLGLLLAGVIIGVNSNGGGTADVSSSIESTEAAVRLLLLR